MRSRRQIGKAQSFAGEPVARVHQPADVSEMIAQIVTRYPQRLGVRRPAALLLRHMPLEDALIEQRAADLGMELVVKPRRQSSHFDALDRGCRQQPIVIAIRAGMCLLDIFGNNRSTGHGRLAVDHEDRNFAGWIEQQKFLTALPEPLLRQPGLDTIFAEDQADIARMRT